MKISRRGFGGAVLGGAAVSAIPVSSAPTAADYNHFPREFVGGAPQPRTRWKGRWPKTGESRRFGTHSPTHPVRCRTAITALWPMTATTVIRRMSSF
jgi:hypothetical protein